MVGQPERDDGIGRATFRRRRLRISLNFGSPLFGIVAHGLLLPLLVDVIFGRMVRRGKYLRSEESAGDHISSVRL